MKYILVLLLLLTGVAYGQTTYFIRADTTKLQKVGASNELVILNDTRDTLGALVNIGGGKTAFQRGRASGDTLFLGRDTIIGIGAGGVPSLFARSDARNETGNDMYFSAAGLDFEMDSIKNFTFRSIYETDQAWTNYIQSTIGSLNMFSGNDEDGISQIIAQPTSIAIESIGSGASGSGVNAVLSLSNIEQYAELKAVHSADSDHSRFSAYVDSAIIYSYDSNVYIYPLRHSVTATDKMLVWDSATGKIATRLIPSGGGMANPMTTTGDIIYSSDGSGTPARLGIGTSGQILAVSAGGIPEWVTGGLGTGTVTSVALASGTSGTDVNITGSPITTSGTITLNIPDAGPTARGLITTASQTIAGNKTFSGTTSLVTAIFSSALTSSPSGTSVANLGVIGAGASAAISGSQFQVEGATNTNIRLYMYGSTATTLGVGNNYATAVIGGSLLTEAASGTHPLLSSVIIKAPGITGGSATVTNTATLYIEGAPSATVSGVNTALYVASGGVRLGGIGGAGMVQSDADGDLSVTNFTALTTYTPTLTGIANVTTLTAYTTNYLRLGNMFWIFGEVEIEPTATGATSFGFSLPVSTDVVNSFEWAGTASDALGNVYKIYGDVANERATFESTINASTTQKLSFTIMGKYIAP